MKKPSLPTPLPITDTVQKLRERGYHACADESTSLQLWMGPTANSFRAFCHTHAGPSFEAIEHPTDHGALTITAGSEKATPTLLDLLDRFRNHTALFFDLDDTIVDTSESFDRVICDMVEAKSRIKVHPDELQALRSTGGFNDDWDTTSELLRRREIRLTADQIAQEALPIYLSIAREVETPLLKMSILETLRLRHRLFIVTGRTRAEYEPVWHHRLGHLFDEVVCKDDNLDLKPKPAPDQILDLLQRHDVSQGYYIGNSVDDMRAARAAQITPIGVGTNQSQSTLIEAGAEIALPHSRELESLWRLERLLAPLDDA